MTLSPQSYFDLLEGIHDSPHDTIYGLVRRMELLPQLLRRNIEEELISIVPVDDDIISKKRLLCLDGQSLEELLHRNRWSSEDFDIHIARSEVLRRFAEQRFGPGLEEAFLASGGGHDQVIYSILRVKDPGLAQELWIRLAEGEAVFSDLASSFGEGPEAARNGLQGPVPIGNIAPFEISTILRTLENGEINPPFRLGDWIVLLRLEQLTPSRYDASMRNFLLDQQLNAFLDSRVQKILSGEAVEPLEFHSSL